MNLNKIIWRWSSLIKYWIMIISLFLNLSNQMILNIVANLQKISNIYILEIWIFEQFHLNNEYTNYEITFIYCISSLKLKQILIKLILIFVNISFYWQDFFFLIKKKVRKWHWCNKNNQLRSICKK